MVERLDRLNPADEGHLQFLRRQVDRLEQTSLSRDAPAHAKNELFRAREELRQFVEGKRRQGYPI